MLKIAELAIASLPPNADKPYHYYIPNELLDLVKTGSRVVVPFGGANRQTRAIIIKILDKSEHKSLKQIRAVIDNGEPIEKEFLELALYIKQRYFCNLYDAVKAMLPTGLDVALTKSVKILGEIFDGANATEQEVYAFVAKKNIVSVKILEKTFGNKILKVLHNLESNNSIEIIEALKKKVSDKSIKIVSLLIDDQQAETLATKLLDTKPLWAKVLNTLIQAGELSTKELTYQTGASMATLNTLKKREYIKISDEIINRVPNFKKLKIDKNVKLTENQLQIYKQIKTYFGSEYKSGLLFGITGSGKTLIYIKLVMDAIAKNKSAIVMVPEISLTSQMLMRFYKVFGEKIAVIHSGLSIGERLDEYKRIKQGKAKLAIGTRSAVFAPVNNLGLIIIDEEQEHTYKSESSPRYNTKEVAAFRARANNANLLMSSATPSIETTYLAKIDRIGFFELTERYNKGDLPNVITVDMRDEIKKGNTGSISIKLAEEIEKNLNNKEQIILFINRRGYNSLVSCRNCGYVATCECCGISLTYHSKNNRLMCHYCNYSVENSEICPSCGQKDIKYVGTGTQRVEAEIKELFPQAKVLRMDADTTTRKESHQKIITEFEDGKYDILIGTQMVTKGLDFPNVTLSAVVMADLSLYSDDFRAGERTFSLVTQLIGRAGRASKKGRSIIQTYNPNNKILNLAFSQNYMEMYDEEIKLRKALEYPPFCDICQILFEGADELTTENAAKHFIKLLKRNQIDAFKDVFYKGFGPTAASIFRINNKYRFKLLIKCRNTKRYSELLLTTLGEYYSDKTIKTVPAVIHINPEIIA